VKFGAGTGRDPAQLEIRQPNSAGESRDFSLTEGAYAVEKNNLKNLITDKLQIG